MLWAALIIIILLILFSIYGAFLGSEGAQNFFNCPVLMAYWFVLGLMLIAGIIIFRRLLLIHIGCILVLLGAMLGSDAGHGFRQKLLGINKIHKGQMLIYQGQESNKVKVERDSMTEELPFSIKLKKFRVDYYEPKYPRHSEDKFLPSYRGAVRDYISSLAVIENGKTVAEKNVEVNHPLHYGGYYFYQHSYDAQDGQYSVLMVVSDSGWAFVYAGYVALCIGVIQHFWLRNIFGKKDVPNGN
jgi:hypothetical protein